MIDQVLSNEKTLLRCTERYEYVSINSLNLDLQIEGPRTCHQCHSNQIQIDAKIDRQMLRYREIDRQIDRQKIQEQRDRQKFKPERTNVLIFYRWTDEKGQGQRKKSKPKGAISTKHSSSEVFSKLNVIGSTPIFST